MTMNNNLKQQKESCNHTGGKEWIKDINEFLEKCDKRQKPKILNMKQKMNSSLYPYIHSQTKGFI
jgi:hypothetical protein